MVKAKLRNLTWLPDFRVLFVARQREDGSEFLKQIRRIRPVRAHDLAHICNRLAQEGYGSLVVLGGSGWGYHPYERRRKEMPTLAAMQVETEEVLEWAEGLSEGELVQLINKLTELALQLTRDEPVLTESLRAYRLGWHNRAHAERKAIPARLAQWGPHGMTEPGSQSSR